MTVFERFGLLVCEELMYLLRHLGLVQASNNVLNFAEVHFLKKEPTHICSFKAFTENGEVVGFRCSKCGRVEKPSEVSKPTEKKYQPAEEDLKLNVIEKIGSEICKFLCTLCLKLGWIELAHSIFNFIQIHYLKVTPTHFCKYRVIRKDGRPIVRCKSCGKEIIPR